MSAILHIIDELIPAIATIEKNPVRNMLMSRY